MAFIRRAGKVKTVLLPVTPSTVLTRDTVVAFSSGKLIAAVAGEAAIDMVGIIRHTIAATDTDYASDRLIPIEVPVEKHVEYECDVNASLVATDLGTEYDLAGAGTIDHAATTDKVAKVIRYISATKGIFFLKLNGSY